MAQKHIHIIGTSTQSLLVLELRNMCYQSLHIVYVLDGDPHYKNSHIIVRTHMYLANAFSFLPIKRV